MEANVYSNKTLVPVTYLGQIIRDNFNFFFQEYSRTTTFTQQFLAVTEENPNVPSVFDGFIGLLPWQFYPDQKENNFMWQLKNTGKIDHMVASFYIKGSSGNSSSIKFGSYDEQGIAPGAQLAMYRARGIEWEL